MKTRASNATAHPGMVDVDETTPKAMPQKRSRVEVAAAKKLAEKTKKNQDAHTKEGIRKVADMENTMQLVDEETDLHANHPVAQRVDRVQRPSKERTSKELPEEGKQLFFTIYKQVPNLMNMIPRDG